MTKLGPYELNSIITGDARELAQAIPDESVDLIFTDPVYDRIEDYEWLAETAKRVLKDDRACLVWYQTGLLDQTIEALKRGGLSFVWQLMMKEYGNPYPGKTGIRVYSGCLWFEKGSSRILESISDYADGLMYGRVELPIAKNSHIWGKSPDVISKWLKAFTQPGTTVFDPFTGGGTVPAVCKMLGRNYLAFEIDPATADKARQRVQMTQPPLLLPEPVQLEMIAT